MYKTGLVSISFRKKSPEEILMAMKSAGLACVEWGSDVHAPCNDTESLKNIVELQRNYGIECSSYGTYFRLGVTPVEELIRYINAARVLGTDILRLWCGDKDSEEYTQEEKEKLFIDCRRAAGIALENGVKLCMECHNWTYTNRLDSALELMDAVNCDSFKMYWQPNQFRTEAENLEYAEKIAPYSEHIHVFNWKGKEKYPLEDGIEIWKKYLEKFPPDKTLLLEFMPDDNIESLGRETAALNKICG